MSLLAAILVGCGSNDDDPAPAPPAAAAPPPAVAGTIQVVAPDPARLTSSALVTTLPKTTVDAANAERGWAALSGPARCDVQIHSIVHPTTGPKGEETNASGAVLVPGGVGCPGPYPVVTYARGTDRDRARTMSTPDNRETQAITGYFAARGYVVVATDYLGYGQSTFPYSPYLNAESEARTSIDSLRAARVLLARLGVVESGKLFVSGYSQGGHAALATQRAIERDRPADVPQPTAVGAMSGPYDLVGSFSEVARLLPLLTINLSGSSSVQSAALRLGDSLGVEATDLLREQDRVREVLAANSVIDYTPRAPMLLCGGARDPIVPFGNTTRAAQAFTSRGASVISVDVDQVPAYAPLLPPPGAPLSDLGSYHQGAVPAPCFAAVRDQLFEPRR